MGSISFMDEISFMDFPSLPERDISALWDLNKDLRVRALKLHSETHLKPLPREERRLGAEAISQHKVAAGSP